MHTRYDFHKNIQVVTLRKQKGVQAGRFQILHKVWSSKSLELFKKPSHPPRQDEVTEREKKSRIFHYYVRFF